MDRRALSNRIKGLSEIFASKNVFSDDLRAMSHVLERMSDDKFASILNPEYNADKEAYLGGLGQGHPEVKAGPAKLQQIRERMRKQDTPSTIRTPEEFAQMAAKVLGPKMNDPQFVGKVVRELKQMSGEPTPEGAPSPEDIKIAEDENVDDTVGMYWNKEASDAVANAIVKDVTGMDKTVPGATKRHLDKEQMPDSEKKQETPSTLKGDQVPQNKENHDSGIVEKAKSSKGKKEAGTEKPGVPDGTGPGKDSPECPFNKEKKEAPSEGSEEGEAVDKIKEGLKEFKKVEDKEKEEGEEGEHEDKEQEAIKKIEEGVEMIEEAEKEEGKEDEDESKEEEGKEEKDNDDSVNKDKKEASMDDSMTVESEGIELVAPMNEVELSSEDQAELGKLFS